MKVRTSTLAALRAWNEENNYRRRLFPGHLRSLGLEMALALRLTALRAKAGRDLRPEAFRDFKEREFREAGVSEEVVANAMGVPGPWPRRER